MKDKFPIYESLLLDYLELKANLSADLANNQNISSTTLNYRMLPIRVINLESSIKRRIHIKMQLDNLGLDYLIIVAVDGKMLSKQDIDYIYDEERTLDFRGRPLSRGEIGCALSHITLYKEIIENRLDAMLILEDDIFIDSRILSVLMDTCSYPEDWDIIFIGYRARRTFSHSVDSPMHFLKEGLTLNRVAGLQGVRETNGYLVSHAGAVKLLELTKGLHKPIDLYTGDYNTLNIYLVKPRLIQHLQNSFRSTIDDDRSTNHRLMQLRIEKDMLLVKFPWLRKFPKTMTVLAELRIIYGARKLWSSIMDRVILKLYSMRHILKVKMRK
ncbi:MAG: glycosyltransferase family 25 protein [Gammaproteobacteria bacterium]|nr:glycosyltransferase family 25 protein [Gammaproteobacteria bacterium]MCY4218115.1 glycosyltransferase family 25 protein [Gammaproteobacteria bacterium]